MAERTGTGLQNRNDAGSTPVSDSALQERLLKAYENEGVREVFAYAAGSIEAAEERAETAEAALQEAERALREALCVACNAHDHIVDDLQPEFKKLGEGGRLAWPWSGEYDQARAAMRLATWWHGAGHEQFVERMESVLAAAAAPSERVNEPGALKGLAPDQTETPVAPGSLTPGAAPSGPDEPVRVTARVRSVNRVQPDLSLSDADWAQYADDGAAPSGPDEPQEGSLEERVDRVLDWWRDNEAPPTLDIALRLLWRSRQRTLGAAPSGERDAGPQPPETT